ncbi:hypothetical protein, partial [Burkholderia gladioli]|uniref:hypothetical protein n=1 Tax=Burkholderia gladioli TaxID=28095 RepID=UPI001ABA64F3
QTTRFSRIAVRGSLDALSAALFLLRKFHIFCRTLRAMRSYTEFSCNTIRTLNLSICSKKDMP